MMRLQLKFHKVQFNNKLSCKNSFSDGIIGFVDRMFEFEKEAFNLYFRYLSSC
jgi:hypothetical protein